MRFVGTTHPAAWQYTAYLPWQLFRWEGGSSCSTLHIQPLCDQGCTASCLQPFAFNAVLFLSGSADLQTGSADARCLQSLLQCMQVDTEVVTLLNVYQRTQRLS